MKKTWMKELAGLGLGLVATAGIAQAQAPDAPAAPPAANPAQPRQGGALERKPGDLPGPIDSVQDVQDSLKMAFMMADQNHDGLISQREATDAGNMLVGGLFFTADANGDGTLTKEEAQQAREKVLQNNPILRFVAQRAKNSAQQEGANTNVAQNLGNLIDSDNDRQIKASEVRQAVQSSIQGLFAVADTNRDNQLSPTEMNAAVYGLAQAGLQAAFQAADGDKNGSLSKEEFGKALVEPGNVVFDILDANLDGQLTGDELERAGRVVASQVQVFRIPQASNSPDRLIQEGRRPEEVAPVPNVRIPATNRAPGQPATAPAQPPAAPRQP